MAPPPEDDRRRPSNRSAYRDQTPRAPSRRQEAATASYKTALHKIFDGGGLPPALRERLGAPLEDPAADKQRSLEEAVVSASDVRSLRKAATYLLACSGATFAEPALLRLLEVADAETQRLAIEQLTARYTQKTLKRAAALRGRLETLLVDSDEPDVVQKAQALVTLLKSK